MSAKKKAAGRGVPFEKALRDVQDWHASIHEDLIIAGYERLQRAYVKSEPGEVQAATEAYLKLLQEFESAPYPPLADFPRKRLLQGWRWLGDSVSMLGEADQGDFYPLVTSASRSIGEARGWVAAMGVKLSDSGIFK